jgi:tetratricopeptide (TPR) repeat protein
MTTRYNVYFNGNESYKEGMTHIFKSNVDDYTKVLPLYPISNTGSANAASMQMERAIDKAKKAIKLHSIRKKPKKDPKRIKNAKYQAFLKQEEYNEQIDEAWILFGKAQFHKANFLPAVGTFTYITRHFFWNKSAVSEARIWLARSYAEMGWYYDADEALNQANKEQVPAKLSGLFAAAKSDLLLKQRQYKDAIPFLLIAVENEQDKKQRTRFYFVLAQLYRMQHENEKATFYYSRVIKASPPFEMAFNARLNRAEADGKNTEKSVKALMKMLKNTQYAKYKGKIYYTIGLVYQGQNQLPQAITNYKLAIEKSKNDVPTKLQALVTLADLHYNQSKYLLAQPYYNEAASGMQMSDPDYERVSKRSQMLGELAQQQEIVVLQDSLQALSRLTEKERVAKVEALIKKLQEDDAAMKKKLAEETEAQNNQFASDSASAQTMSLINKNQGNWYFYNKALIPSGKTDFIRRWGSRKLEDNWRRKDKAVVTMDEEPQYAENDSTTKDATQKDKKGLDAKSDSSGTGISTNVQQYLKQVPSSENQIKASNEQIAAALYKMGMIYMESLEDMPLAIQTFEELERRFPMDKRLPDAYYSLYQMNMKAKDSVQADIYRNRLIAKFPESTYAKALSQPDFVQKMIQMNLVQDSLYQISYIAYTKSDYPTVFSNYKNVKEKYPLSPLIPKFMFINALSEGKTGNQELFRTGLKQLITEYPKSDVSAMAKDILALAMQGREVQAGNSFGSILHLRDSLNARLATGGADSLKFSPDKRDRHLIIIVAPKEVDMNKLQFDVASYNFTGFLVKNFDLDIEKYKANTNLLVISALDDLDEAQWYQQGLVNNQDVQLFLKTKDCYSFVISEVNYQLIKKGLTIDSYLDFYNTQIAPPPVKQEKSTKADTTQASSMFRQSQTDSVATSVVGATAAQANNEVAGKNAESQTQAGNNLKQDTVAVKVEAPKFKVDMMDPHAYAIVVLKGSFDFKKLKKALDAYNAKNYVMANLRISQVTVGQQQIIVVGMLSDANTAKSYLFGIIRERELFDENLKGTEYRNVIISNRNLQELVKTKGVSEYLDFNRNTYMKQ